MCTCVVRCGVGAAATTGRYGVALLSVSRRAAKLVALVAQSEERDEDGFQIAPAGINVIPLPFADDFRSIPVCSVVSPGWNARRASVAVVDFVVVVVIRVYVCVACAVLTVSVRGSPGTSGGQRRLGRPDARRGRGAKAPAADVQQCRL